MSGGVGRVSEPEFQLPPDDLLSAILEGVSTIFYSLGRSLICLNSNFQIVHASVALDQLIELLLAARDAVGLTIGPQPPVSRPS